MTDLAAQLKAGTKKSHTMAENTSFVASFLRGVVSEESYRVLIANFYFVYRAMEEQLFKYKDHPCIAPIYFTELNRTDALAEDCEYYYGKDWRNIIQPSDATQQYVNRIREVEPETLVGHHYTRYLGDLSGGQILATIASNSLNLPEGKGLKFYDFPTITDKKGFKTSYRTALDSLPLDIHDINKIIVEANYAFRLNMYMFDELEGNSLKSFVKVLCSIVRKGKMT